MSSGNGKPPPEPAAASNLQFRVEPAEPEATLAQKIQALRERVKTIRDGSLLKRSQVLNQEPGVRYLWVNIHPDRRSFFEAMGWVVVRRADATTRFFDPAAQEHRRGDVVLYQIGEEEADMLEKYNILRGIESAGQDVESNFATAVAKHGIKTFRPPV